MLKNHKKISSFEKRKLKCYFAHSFGSKGTPEEKEIIMELEHRGIEVLNPFDGEDRLMLEKYGRDNYYPDPPYKLAREMWAKDMRQVHESDMLLLYVHGPDGHLTGGCGYELGEAFRHHKFIQIISASKHPSLAFVLGCGNQMYLTIDDWKKYRQYKWEEEEKDDNN